MEGPRNSIVVITGPTAVGKTALAVTLASDVGGEIVNADSMQVYRHMDVGTAKPGPEEMRGVPHHLLDVADPNEPFNAARYRALALPAIESIIAEGKPCLVVGGSGLYIRALLGGLFDCPDSSPVIRSRLNLEWKEKGGPHLYRRLQTLDPVAALKIHPNDRVRVTRALEVIEVTGRRFSALTGSHGFREETFRTLMICLHVDREILYGKINRRSAAMMSEGLLEETENLLRMGYSEGLKPMQAIGYRHAVSLLRGEIKCLDQAIVRLQADTRRYAKRQVTWFRKQPGVIWRSPGDMDLIRRETGAFLEYLS